LHPWEREQEAAGFHREFSGPLPLLSRVGGDSYLLRWTPVVGVTYFGADPHEIVCAWGDRKMDRVVDYSVRVRPEGCVVQGEGFPGVVAWRRLGRLEPKSLHLDCELLVRRETSDVDIPFNDEPRFQLGSDRRFLALAIGFSNRSYAYQEANGKESESENLWIPQLM
jgi:hypothetical protein